MLVMEPLPQYWSPAEDRVQAPGGKTYALRLWGWSVSSAADAASVAARRLGEVAHRIRTGQPLGRDYYPRTPLREEPLREIRGDSGELLGVISRNSYGAEILNTDQILIADVDLPSVRPAALRTRMLARIFGADKRDRQGLHSEGTVVERIQEFARTRPHFGVHMYRTAAGFRVLITGAQAPPDSEEARRILSDLAADPLYARLCAVHRTYRARLTPKPWRAGMRALPHRWPWTNQAAADRAARWIGRYREQSARYAVCQRIRRGSAAPSPAEGLLIEAHDRAVLGRSDLPLA